MKRFIIFVLCFSSLTCFSQSIHNLSFSDIDGATVSLNNYAGKKIIFLIAPVSPADSNQILQIKSFQQKFGTDSIKIIGVMSFEDGYLAGNKENIKSLYQNREVDITLTTGMYTRKSAGSSQSALLRWLTTKDENDQYDIDTRGIGQKFFINRSGKLYGVIPPQFSLQDKNVIMVFKRSM